MIRGLLSSALRAATSLKLLTPKEYFVFFWGPRGGRQGWDRTPKRFAKQKDLREFSGFPKIFFAEKDFWEKEEQALKPWCLPQGKYPERVLWDRSRAPKKICEAKIFGKRRSKRLKRGVCRQENTRKERLKWGPRKDFCEAKRFVGKGAAGIRAKPRTK